MTPKAYTIGAMLFDQQLRRAEQLEAKAVEDVRKVGSELVEKAGRQMTGVKTALVLNGLLTVGSTVVLMRAARGGRRG